MPFFRKHKSSRSGGIYLAVLGTSLIVALLGLSALVGQRIQNRILVAASDIRQAELNANSAVELALLAMKQDANWRSTYSNGTWFASRGTTAGTCSASVTDPIDSNLPNNVDQPVTVLGIGYCGQAEQRVQVAIDPIKQPLSCLRSAIGAGDLIDLQSDILRTNGLITANQITASSSNVYGAVEAVTVSGSTYAGTTTQVTSAMRPTMPDWTSVFNYYKTNGAQLDITQFPQQTPNLGRNTSFDDDKTYWTGTATGLPAADIDRRTDVSGHVACLRVRNRTALTAGPSQYIDHIVKAGASYNITIQILPNSLVSNYFRVKLATKGSGAVQTNQSSAILLTTALGWQDVNVTLTAPIWGGLLEYARITIDTDAALGSTNDFHIDNLDIRENVSGRFIYRQVIGPGVNTLYSGAPTNSQGIYWVNCAGNRLVIERSRIVGTLLVINPGAGSCVSNGPINWIPAKAGYPALLVDADTVDNADFAIYATNRALNEKENGTNYNPAGATSDEFNTDGGQNDTYRSCIRGLIAVRDDLTYANRALIRGNVLVGDDISNASGEMEVEYLQDSLLNPPPGLLAPYLYQRRPVSIQKVVLP